MSGRSSGRLFAIGLIALMATIDSRSSPATLAPAAAPAQVRDAVVRQPRAIGHFIGDVISQRVRLEYAEGVFTPQAMPRVERVGVWFERRAVTLEKVEGAPWLILEYQIVSVPQRAGPIVLPELQLVSSDGRSVLRIPHWQIDVAALTPAQVSPEQVTQLVRPERWPEPVPTYAASRRLTIYVAGTLLALVAWAGWFAWRNWRARQRQPFAHAWSQLRQLDERDPQAWQVLHRAFDQTAGAVTHHTTLAALFERAPHLRSQRAAIERFYAASSALFFGDGLSNDSPSVRELCRNLCRIEQRYER